VQVSSDGEAFSLLKDLAAENGLDVAGGAVRRTSSRFCLGVEHGDYNGTELFGVATDRFIWLAWKPNGTNRVRLFSGNFPAEGVIDFALDSLPPPRSPQIADRWARFPYGVAYILRKNGFDLRQGFDGVLYGNIPGGGMSRSASLTINLMLTFLEVNGLSASSDFQIIDMAQAVENEYIGSPCGQLDQIMIYFSKAGMGTHYNPRTRTVSYVALGEKAPDFRLVSLDTGTVRPGLEKSTYRIRRAECEELVERAKEAGFQISCLADVEDEDLYDRIVGRFGKEFPHLCDRLTYIFNAQKRFREMLEAWKRGDIETVGRVFREDGIGLRDEYCISGPELETMCDIARTVPGVLGERMLGGGDKGAAGAVVRADSVEALREAVAVAYPRSRPLYADKYAVHGLRVVQGVERFEGVL